MPWSIADTQYDNSHPWDSMFNGVPLSSVLKQGPFEQKLMSQFMLVSDPRTDPDFIRANMTAGPPADAGPGRPQPTIETVLSGEALQPPHLWDRPMNDFSGTPAGMEASSRNTLGG